MLSRIGTSPAVTRIVGALPDGVLRRLYYYHKHKRYPNLDNPQSFTELLQERMIRERSDDLAWTCDKLRMKAYAAATTDFLSVPNTYWYGVDLNELHNIELPPHWVLKPNHRSQAVYFGTDTPDPGQLTIVTKGWLKTYERAYLGEWAYSTAQHCFLVEESLGGTQVLNDYKFYVFGGVPRLIHVDSSRFSRYQGRRFYTPSWTALEYTSAFPLGPIQAAPKFLDQMLAAASDLGRQFDFMRIDLYETEDRVFFGELTPYPGGGIHPFDPTDVDYELGSYWLAARRRRKHAE